MNKTYLNKYSKPMVRKCSNCENYTLFDGKENLGYCKLINLYFAFTHEKNVYAIVKDFYLCENHKFRNEEILAKESKEVDLLRYLLERENK